MKSDDVFVVIANVFTYSFDSPCNPTCKACSFKINTFYAPWEINLWPTNVMLPCIQNELLAVTIFTV